MNFEVEQSIHGPARIAEMTGLSMDGQRNWRQRGHLGPSDGPRGKMTTASVAALAVRAYAAEIGYPAKESESLGDAAGPSVTYAAVIGFPQAALRLIGSPEAKRSFWKAYEESPEAAAIISGLGETRPSERISWYDSAPPTLLPEGASDALETFEVTFRQLRLAGLGARLIQYAAQPLCTVHLPEA